MGRGVSRSPFGTFYSLSAERLHKESFTVAVISVTEKVWIRGRGKSRFSVENFLSHSAGKNSSGNPLLLH